MTEEPYSNREIKHFFEDTKKQLNRIEADGKETKGHAKDTNGKVAENILKIAKLKTRIDTTIWALSITVPLLLTLGGYIFLRELEAIRESIPQKVSEALQDYEIQVYEEGEIR